MDKSSSYWTSPHRCTHIYSSDRSQIGYLEYQHPRPQFPHVAVAKTYQRIEKHVQINPSPDADSEKTIRSEQDAHCQISPMHPNILKYYHSINTKNSTTMYLEYADYGNGDKLVEELKIYGRFDEASLLNVMAQLTGALAAMHEQGWAHRDIKPANIFIFLNNCIKLGDFGCAKRIYDPDDPNTVAGTDAYMSPEVASAHAQNLTMSSYDPFMSDIYSLGSCFFIFATCRDLSQFGDITDEESERLFKQFVSQSLLECSFSQDLGNLIVQMLALNAKDRPKAKQVLETIKRLQGIHESLPPPPPPPQEPIACCLKCHNPKPDNEYLTLTCEHRICCDCFSTAIESQAPQLSDNRGFRCPLCASSLDPFFITNNQNRLSDAAALQATIVMFLSFESPCPMCSRVHPMFIRGKKIKKVKPHFVHCPCGVKFCSFCSHKGKHRRALILPTTHCPHYDPKQYV